MPEEAINQKEKILELIKQQIETGTPTLIHREGLYPIVIIYLKELKYKIETIFTDGGDFYYIISW